jgi:ATP-dependent DNA helicase RecG
MTAYADLDLSLIDELPPGRKPINTLAMAQHRREEIIQRIRSHCETGQQIYWVCTLIEESETLNCQAAEKTAELLKLSLPNINIGLVHGRLKPKDKQAIMSDFSAGISQLLVATTVIEVGVNVPNASLMIIENPERLGLAQLHQLRGRIGRGELQSHCLLLYQTPLSRQAKERIKIMRETNDGFKIAETDLRLRGPGEVLGSRQTGLLNFRIADIERDALLIAPISDFAKQLMAAGHDNSALIKRWIFNAENYAQA